MAYVKISQRSELDGIKDNIQKGWLYFRNNYKIFNDFVRFTFKTTLTPTDRSVNQQLQKPNMEWNIVEAYISRLCGEFSKMEPGFTVRAKEGVNLVNPDVIDLVEAHLRSAFGSSNLNTLSYYIYRNLLSGGYDVAKIYTDYADEMSFDQKICIEQVFDPTLTVFDPMARQPHKGDGRFACELFPKSMDEAMDMYGSDVLKGIDFTRDANVESFNWSYRNQQEDIVLFAEYYKKRMKRTKILKLANGHTVTEKHYEDFLDKWGKAGIMEQAPAILKSRTTDITCIDKYTLTASGIVDCVETNFNMLPLVFFDGNSVTCREDSSNTAEQVIRPYIYNAKDNQRMKNFAGQSLCNEIEGLVQHKWKAPVEGIPANKDYQIAYTSPQQATVVLYNQFKDGDPNQPLNPPQEIQRAPIPPELLQTFTLADNTMQVILGSYDAAIGANENDISGIAIMQGAMQSNAAAMPFTTGFIFGWARCAEIYMNLLPKYYVTPRTIPVVLPDGKRDYYDINKQGNISFDYDINALEVTVEPGVNYEVQKQIALKTITMLMGVSESFKEFMDQNGLGVLLDNIDIRGIDKLKYLVDQWMEQQQEAAQQQQKANANQPTPEQLQANEQQLEAQRIQVDAEKNQQDAANDKLKNLIEASKANARAAVDNKEADIKFLQVMGQVQGDHLDRIIDQQRVDSENARTQLDAATKMNDHLIKIGSMLHEASKDGQESEAGQQGNDSEADGA
jgi:hypothetical protein